ncbi:MAG: helix-turn-helix transcriptional regulator [Chloroflexota bacterium]
MSSDQEQKDRLKRLIGKRLKDAREQRGMSQRELADRVGKTQSAISNYEAGTSLMHITELPDFARVLDVSIGYFFGEPHQSKNVEPDSVLFIQDGQIIEHFRRGLANSTEPSWMAHIVDIIEIRDDIKKHEKKTTGVVRDKRKFSEDLSYALRDVFNSMLEYDRDMLKEIVDRSEKSDDD